MRFEDFEGYYIKLKSLLKNSMTVDKVGEIPSSPSSGGMGKMMRELMERMDKMENRMTIIEDITTDEVEIE